jgi:hypothetical protein
MGTTPGCGREARKQLGRERAWPGPPSSVGWASAAPPSTGCGACRDHPGASGPGKARSSTGSRPSIGAMLDVDPTVAATVIRDRLPA